MHQFQLSISILYNYENFHKELVRVIIQINEGIKINWISHSFTNNFFVTFSFSFLGTVSVIQ